MGAATTTAKAVTGVRCPMSASIAAPASVPPSTPATVLFGDRGVSFGPPNALPDDQAATSATETATMTATNVAGSSVTMPTSPASQTTPKTAETVRWLPGFGGLLDRIDSLLPALAVLVVLS